MACPAMGACFWFARSEDSNSCAGDRRLRRKQGAEAGAAVAEGKPRPRGAARCGYRNSYSAGRPTSRPAKTPLRGVFRARESPRGSSRPAARGGGRALRKLFAAPSPSGRLQRSRKRSASARGDRSLKTLRRSVFLTRPLPAPNHANPNVLLFEGAFGFVFYLQSMNMK